MRHIRDEAAYLADQAGGLSRDRFLQDETLKRAFVRSIEIIGEATKSVPSDIRQRYPEIDWRAMAGMRDRLVHGYFGVDFDIVWDVASSKAASLQRQIEALLREEAGS